MSTFEIKRCKILCFMKHFYRSLESSRVRALQNTVNVWGHMSRMTSRCLEQFGWFTCDTSELIQHNGSRKTLKETANLVWQARQYFCLKNLSAKLYPPLNRSSIEKDRKKNYWIRIQVNITTKHVTVLSGLSNTSVLQSSSFCHPVDNGDSGN